MWENTWAKMMSELAKVNEGCLSTRGKMRGGCMPAGNSSTVSTIRGQRVEVIG